MKQLIVYYDGYCVFCNFWVRKLCQWDRKEANAMDLQALDSVPLGSAKYPLRLQQDLIISTVDALICWNQKISPLPKTASANFYKFSIQMIYC